MWPETVLDDLQKSRSCRAIPPSARHLFPIIVRKTAHNHLVLLDVALKCLSDVNHVTVHAKDDYYFPPCTSRKHTVLANHGSLSYEAFPKFPLVRIVVIRHKPVCLPIEPHYFITNTGTSLIALDQRAKLLSHATERACQ